jgi:hypothetical protein
MSELRQNFSLALYKLEKRPSDLALARSMSDIGWQ